MNVTTLDAIQEELARQDAKWGCQRQLSREKWAIILGEEFGEVCQAVCEHDPAAERLELVQIAAVAIQALESLEAVPRPNPVPQATPARM